MRQRTRAADSCRNQQSTKARSALPGMQPACLHSHLPACWPDAVTAATCAAAPVQTTTPAWRCWTRTPSRCRPSRTATAMSTCCCTPPASAGRPPLMRGASSATSRWPGSQAVCVATRLRAACWAPAAALALRFCCSPGRAPAEPQGRWRLKRWPSSGACGPPCQPAPGSPPPTHAPRRPGRPLAVPGLQVGVLFPGHQRPGVPRAARSHW